MRNPGYLRVKLLLYGDKEDPDMRPRNLDVAIVLYLRGARHKAKEPGHSNGPLTEGKSTTVRRQGGSRQEAKESRCSNDPISEGESTLVSPHGHM